MAMLDEQTSLQGGLSYVSTSRTPGFRRGKELIPSFSHSFSPQKRQGNAKKRTKPALGEVAIMSWGTNKRGSGSEFA